MPSTDTVVKMVMLPGWLLGMFVADRLSGLVAHGVVTAAPFGVQVGSNR